MYNTIDIETSTSMYTMHMQCTLLSWNIHIKDMIQRIGVTGTHNRPLTSSSISTVITHIFKVPNSGKHIESNLFFLYCTCINSQSCPQNFCLQLNLSTNLLDLSNILSFIKNCQRFIVLYSKLSTPFPGNSWGQHYIGFSRYHSIQLDSKTHFWAHMLTSTGISSLFIW